jgi:cell division protein FtsI/penicillin-binding protein 2
MLDMMQSVWNQQSLIPLRLDGYQLAAKSGTADIPAPNGYSTGKTYASFAGFAPMPNPRFAILVRIDRPEGIYGGVAAAPVFRSIVAELMSYYQVPPSDFRAVTPDSRGMSAIDSPSNAGQPQR